MKKLIFIGLSFLFTGLILIACNKDNSKEISYEGDKPVSVSPPTKQQWPPSINIDVPFEPIRLARSTTERPRDGKNCGCNECFGICNRPWNGIGTPDNGVFAKIGVEKISDKEAILYFLESKPSNFDTEFGIDEIVELKQNGTVQYSIKTGEYTTISEEGFVYCSKENKAYSYFGKVQVHLVN